jgi:hypothetical protein
LWQFDLFWFASPKSIKNAQALMQVIATLMSKSQLNVLEPEVTLILGLILSPLEGILILQSLLQVAIEIAHKQIINCGITAGV